MALTVGYDEYFYNTYGCKGIRENARNVISTNANITKMKLRAEFSTNVYQRST
jgi:hypothetical protein